MPKAPHPPCAASSLAKSAISDHPRWCRLFKTGDRNSTDPVSRAAMCKVNASCEASGPLGNVCAACTWIISTSGGAILNNKEVIGATAGSLMGSKAGDAPPRIGFALRQHLQPPLTHDRKTGGFPGIFHTTGKDLTSVVVPCAFGIIYRGFLFGASKASMIPAPL